MEKIRRMQMAFEIINETMIRKGRYRIKQAYESIEYIIKVRKWVVEYFKQKSNNFLVIGTNLKQISFNRIKEY